VPNVELQKRIRVSFCKCDLEFTFGNLGNARKTVFEVRFALGVLSA